MNGTGKMNFTNGDRYEGDFFQGAQTGYGIYYFAGSGDIYRGDFVDGLKVGQGTYSVNPPSVTLVHWKIF